MNKTISVNISGFIFNIEEDAYRKLQKYLEAIKQYFSTSDSGDEIVHDIEYRIAELFQERLSEIKQVITELDVDEVIAIMGRPEQYDEGEADDSYQESKERSSTARARIYRDPDDRVIGGVCSGISHYLGWDPVILRLILALMVIFGGTGVILYIILWVALPEAKSTNEKMKMKGEKINVENISKKVKNDLDNVKENLSDLADKGKRAGSKVSDSTRKVANQAEGALSGLGAVLKKLIGLFLFIIGILSLIGVVIGSTAINHFAFSGEQSWSIFETMVLENNETTTLAFVGLVLFIGSFLVGMIWTGLRLLLNIQPKIRGIGLTLFGIFVVGIVLLGISGINFGRQFQDREDVTNSQSLDVATGDTLYVMLKHDDKFNDHYEFNHENPFNLMKIEDDLVYHGTGTRFRMYGCEESLASLSIEKEAQGSGHMNALEHAENIEYDWSVEGDTIYLSPYFTTPLRDKWKSQDVDVVLKVPQGVFVKLDDKISRISWYNRKKELFQEAVLQADSVAVDLEYRDYTKPDF